jgi:hypothetical protein
MRSLGLALTLLRLSALAVGAQQDSFMVLQGGTLIDGRGGAPIEDAVVVVRGDRTRNIRMVIQGGKVMGTAFDPNWVNPVPRPTQFSPR